MMARQLARPGRTPPTRKRAVSGSLAQAASYGAHWAGSSARATSIVSRSRSPRASGAQDSANPTGCERSRIRVPGWKSLTSQCIGQYASLSSSHEPWPSRRVVSRSLRHFLSRSKSSCDRSLETLRNVTLGRRTEKRPLSGDSCGATERQLVAGMRLCARAPKRSELSGSCQSRAIPEAMYSASYSLSCATVVGRHESWARQIHGFRSIRSRALEAESDR